jgi:ketosteroid isomerase-like protein
MADKVSREPARDPQDLERLLVSRQRAGDVDGMAALYEPHAVLDCGGGRLALGGEAIRAFYAELVETGRKFEFGDQRPAIISGDLALTSTRLPDGSVTAEIARRQGDGTWLWVIDQFSMVTALEGRGHSMAPSCESSPANRWRIATPL